MMRTLSSQLEQDALKRLVDKANVSALERGKLASHGIGDVDPKHIGSLGWSMGGALALQLAIHEPRLAACVVNYGALPTKPADIEKINARTLGIFGVLDRGIPPNQVRAFEKRMNAVKKLVEIKIYEGAGHAFENPTNMHKFRPKAAADAWLRTLTFLNQSL
jgi:carboxymethylenebutenolidase